MRLAYLCMCACMNVSPEKYNEELKWHHTKIRCKLTLVTNKNVWIKGYWTNHSTEQNHQRNAPENVILSSAFVQLHPSNYRVINDPLQHAKLSIFIINVYHPPDCPTEKIISPLNVLRIKLLIIYHDFLPTPRRGSHVKSDKTHTVIKIHPLAHILDSWELILSSCALFTVYPNHIM